MYEIMDMDKVHRGHQDLKGVEEGQDQGQGQAPSPKVKLT